MDQMKQAFGQFAAPPAVKQPQPDRLAQTVEGIRVNTHYKVLIVGGRGDNFPQEYRRHPQIVLWDADGQVIPENIPAAVRLALLTRFNRTATFQGIRSVCEKRGIPCPVRAYGTGEIRAMLAPLLAKVNGVHVPDPTPDEGPPAVPKTFMKGALQAFILQHGNPWKAPYKDEADRLRKLAADAGFATTSDSIAQSMYLLRSARAEAGVQSPEPDPVPAAAPAAVPPPETPKAALLPALDGDDAVIMQMIDDAAKQLSDVGAALGLIRQEVVTRAEKRRKLRELLADL